MGTPVKCLLMAMLWQLAHSQESTGSHHLGKHCYSLRGRTCGEVFMVIITITSGFIATVAFAYFLYFLGLILYYDGAWQFFQWLKELCCCGERIDDYDDPHQVIIEDMEEEHGREEARNMPNFEVREYLRGASNGGAIRDAAGAAKETKAVKEAREAAGKREGGEGHDQGSATKKPKIEREPFSMPSSPTGTRINPEVISSTPNKPSRNEGYNFQKAEEQFNPRNLENVEFKEEPVCSENCIGGASTGESSDPTSPKVELPKSSPDYFVLPENATPTIEEVDPSTPAVHPEVAEAKVEHPESPSSRVTSPEAPSESPDLPVVHSNDAEAEVERAESPPGRDDIPSGGTLDEVAESITGEEERKNSSHLNAQEGRGSSGSSFERINGEDAEAEGTSDHASDVENGETAKTLEEANFTANSSATSHNAASEITETSFQSIASGSQKSGAQGSSPREDRQSESKNGSFLKSFVDSRSGSDGNEAEVSNED